MAKKLRHLITKDILLFPGIVDTISEPWWYNRYATTTGQIQITRRDYYEERSERKDREGKLGVLLIVYSLLDEGTYTFTDTTLRLPGVVTEGH